MLSHFTVRQSGAWRSTIRSCVTRMAASGVSDAVQSMPKVELHRHLEGSVRLTTLFELTRNRLGDHAGELTRSQFVFDKPVRDLSVFLEAFWQHQAIFDSYESIERVAFEVVEDCARDGIRLLELRYSPHFIAIGHPHLDFGEIHAAVLRGVRKAQSTLHDCIGVGLIGIIDRMQSVEEAHAAMSFFIEHKDTFVAVDLANDEIKFPAKPFAPEFERARSAGLHVTIHAGETQSPQSPLNVREAITLLGATRVGHGVMAIRDPSVVADLRERGTLLEVCPVSNYCTGLVESLSAHPLKALLAAGVRCCLSTDDPGLFGQSLSEEYQRVLDAGLVTLEQLVQMNSWAAEHCFLPESVKKKYWNNL